MTDATFNLTTPCGSWCFLVGLAGLGPNGAPLGCTEHKGHDGRHRTTVTSFGDPVCEFEITWTVRAGDDA